MARSILGVPYRPQEVIADACPAPLRQVSVALACAVAALLIFASSALQGWAEDLDVNPVNDFVLTGVSSWNHLMHQTGLAVPFDVLREGFERFRSLP